MFNGYIKQPLVLFISLQSVTLCILVHLVCKMDTG